MLRRTTCLLFAFALVGCSSDVEWGDRGARFDAPINWRGTANITQEGGDDVISDPCARPDAINLQDVIRVLQDLKEVRDAAKDENGNGEEPPPADDNTPPPGPLASNGFPPPDQEFVTCATPAPKPKPKCRKFLFWRVPCGDC